MNDQPEWIELNNNTIGDIGLWVTAQEGKFLWTTDPDDDAKWEYIPEELYRELVKFEKDRRGIWHGQ